MIRCKQCKSPLGIIANYTGVRAFIKFAPDKQCPWKAEVELGPGTTYLDLSVRCEKCKVRWVESGARMMGESTLILPAGFVNSAFIEFVYEDEVTITPIHELLERPKDERGSKAPTVVG